MNNNSNSNSNGNLTNSNSDENTSSSLGIPGGPSPPNPSSASEELNPLLTSPHSMTSMATSTSASSVTSSTTGQQQQQQPKQKKQPPPPSPQMYAQLSSRQSFERTSPPSNKTHIQAKTQSSSHCSSRNKTLFKAPPPLSAPTDPQARLRASASSCCPSVASMPTSQRNQCQSSATSTRQTTRISNFNRTNTSHTNPHVNAMPPPSNLHSRSSPSPSSYLPSIPHQTNQPPKETKGEWKTVEVNTTTSPNHGSQSSLTSSSSGSSSSSPPPCERSLHAAALWNDQLLIFGGYDGHARRNDFYSFHFKKREWNLIIGKGEIPTPRDRHCAISYGNSFYIFGGFDGTSRVNDFYEFDFTTMTWKRIISNISSNSVGVGARAGRDRGSSPPSPRHSHSVVVYQDSMYLFGGYDGSYRSDFYEYNFLTNTWINIHLVGRSPRARYRATSVTYKNKMILYGGHDGTRHLSDIHMFDFDSRSWSVIMDVNGKPPLARDSHICEMHGDSMFIFGGSAGSAMNDLHELRLGNGEEANGIVTVNDNGSNGDNFIPTWRHVAISGTISHRFCHVGAMYDGSLYVFGGYDGDARLNDFMQFEFNYDDLSYSIPPSTLVTDMRSFVNNDVLSDVVFIVDDQTIHAHKLMLVRCNYFRAMLTGSMMESTSSSIHLVDVSYPIFLSILEYLYTDKLDIQLERAMELFAAADLFGIPRLQSMCEQKMLQSIHADNAATIFHAADDHCATLLRSKALNFILKHFEEVSKSQGFEEMARNNVDLVVEILRLR